MSQLVLTPENQIQRLNALLNYATSLQQLGLSQLTWQPHPKSWNTLQVLEHLSIAYSLYHDKINHALVASSDAESVVWQYHPGFWNRFIIQGQRPKNGKRPFKMKTLKKFEPTQSNAIVQKDVGTVFKRFFDAHESLKESILASRGKLMDHKKFSSAIGPIVRFHLPEAFEFLICHAERHKVQIESILAAQTG